MIDKDPQSFRRLGGDFHGQQVVGNGFDRNVLIEAGVERAGALAAVSSGDNSNIITARVARETFGVEHVVARIYDHKRAAVYERLGIPTVATVPWSTDRFLRMLLPEARHRVARPVRHRRDPADRGLRGVGRPLDRRVREHASAPAWRS